jgi:hypothetical protein
MKNQKKPLLIIVLILFSNISFCQTDFDSKLSILSDTIANKINLKGKKKVAVWDFTDADGQTTTLG